MRRQFEESEDEFLNEGKSTAERAKEHFILHQEEIKTEREGKRKRGQKHSRKDKRAFYTTPRRNKNGARRKAQTRTETEQSEGER